MTHVFLVSWVASFLGGGGRVAREGRPARARGLGSPKFGQGLRAAPMQATEGTEGIEGR